jgi:hypothetical protein
MAPKSADRPGYPSEYRPPKMPPAAAQPAPPPPKAVPPTTYRHLRDRLGHD